MGGTRSPAIKPRFGIPRKPLFERLEPETVGIIETALREFPGAREVPFPQIEPSPAVPELTKPYLQVIHAEAYAFHKPMVEKAPAPYHPLTRQNIGFGNDVSATDCAGAGVPSREAGLAAVSSEHGPLEPIRSTDGIAPLRLHQDGAGTLTVMGWKAGNCVFSGESALGSF